MEPITIGILAYMAYKAHQAKANPMGPGGAGVTAAQTAAQQVQQLTQSLMTGGLPVYDQIRQILSDQVTAVGLQTGMTGGGGGHFGAYINYSGSKPAYIADADITAASNLWNQLAQAESLAAADGQFSADEAAKLVDLANQVAAYLVRFASQKQTYDTQMNQVDAYEQKVLASTAADRLALVSQFNDISAKLYPAWENIQASIVVPAANKAAVTNAWQQFAALNPSTPTGTANPTLINTAVANFQAAYAAAVSAGQDAGQSLQAQIDAVNTQRQEYVNARIAEAGPLVGMDPAFQTSVINDAIQMYPSPV